MDEFRKQIMGDWQPDPAFRVAYDLWIAYYRSTELFDHMVCRLRSERNGHAIPITPEERSACEANAREKHKLLLERRDQSEVPISDKVWQEAQTAASRDHDRERY